MLRRGSKKKRSHRQKWTRISLFEFLIAAVMCVTSAVFGLTWMLITGILLGLAGAAGLVESRSTPPDARHTVHRPERDKMGYRPGRGERDARVTHGEIRVMPWDGLKSRLQGGYGGDRPRLLHGRRGCGAACQYSRKPAETCECSCGGSMHGTKAYIAPPRKTRGPGKKTASKKGAPRRAPAKKRKAGG